VAGDDALKRLAAAIDASFRRPSDLSARVGGEEFAAILPGTTLSAAMSLGEDLCRNVRELRIPHATSTEGSGFVTVSVGAASIAQNSFVAYNNCHGFPTAPSQSPF
jgi:two-component system chemotaxis family response regulator WspR